MWLRRVHRWLGLVLSSLLLVISVTGVLLVWKPEYLRLSVPGADEPLQVERQQLAAAIDNILLRHTPGSVRLIQIHPNDVSLHKVLLSDKRYAWHNQQGELIEIWHSNQRLEDWLLDLHHRFLLGNKIGLNMAGFSGLLLFALVGVGLVLWWPRRRLLKLGFLPRGQQRGRFMRAHSNIGGVSVLPFLIIAVSGVILVYPVESAKVLLPPPASTPQHLTPLVREGNAAATTLDQLNLAVSHYPASRLRWYRPATPEYPQIIVGLQQPHGFNRVGNSSVTFADGYATETANALAQPQAKRLFDFMFPLHTGMLPLWYRLLLTLFGAALAVVVAFGVWSWSKRGN